ncbi:hypothetical protein D3C73_1406240 [compost metagenome]
MRDRRQHDAGGRNAHHQQRIDALRRQPQFKVRTKKHAGAMGDDDRLIRLSAQFRRNLIVGEQTKLFDALPVFI